MPHALAAGYFGVSDQGCLTVHPTRNPLLGVEVASLINILLQRRVAPPFLFRFPQILDTQIKDFHEAFRNSIAEYGYGARHRGVFPMKVNQKRSVVERLMAAGHRYEYGLEVGTKAELAAALTLSVHPNALLICNGVKDRRYLEWAIRRSPRFQLPCRQSPRSESGCASPRAGRENGRSRVEKLPSSASIPFNCSIV